MTIEEGAQGLNLKCSLQEVGVVGLMWKRHIHWRQSECGEGRSCQDHSHPARLHGGRGEDCSQSQSREPLEVGLVLLSSCFSPLKGMWHISTKFRVVTINGT